MPPYFVLLVREVKSSVTANLRNTFLSTKLFPSSADAIDLLLYLAHAWKTNLFLCIQTVNCKWKCRQQHRKATILGWNCSDIFHVLLTRYFSVSSRITIPSYGLELVSFRIKTIYHIFLLWKLDGFSIKLCTIKDTCSKEYITK